MHKVLACLFLVGALLTAPTSDAASKPSLSEFEWASGTLAAGSHLEWFCDFNWDGSPLSVFAMLSYEQSNGAASGSHTVWGNLDVERTFLHVRAGEIDREIDLEPTSDFPEASERHVFEDSYIREETTIRVGWGIWGEGLNCDFLVNGVSIANDGSPTDAAWFTATDFSSPLAMRGPMTEATANAQLTRTADGYLLGMFTLATGAWRVEGPSGEKFFATAEATTPFCQQPPMPCGYTGPAVIQMDQLTQGDWTYYIDAGVSAYSPGTGLWLLELPE